MQNDYSYRDKLSELGIKLISSGRSTCPQCSETRTNKTEKCLVVTFQDDSVVYHCHHCDFSGIVSYSDTREIRFKATKKEYSRPKPIEPSNSIDKLYRYAEKRGLSKKTIDDYGVTLDKKGNIVFPYFKNAELVNIKTRYTDTKTGKKSFLQSPKAEQTLFGMDMFPTDEKTLIWVEGEFDCLSFYEVGKFAVSVTQGGSDSKLECIDNCFEFVDSFTTHIIAVDNDEVGHKLRDNLIARLKNKVVRVVDWGKYEVIGKDANDFLQKGERGVLLDALNLAEEVVAEGIESFSDYKNELIRFYRGETDITHSTGWNNVDKIFKIQTKRLMVITGISTKGKSFFADNLLFNLTKQYGWKHLICSFEGSRNNHFNIFAQFLNKKSARPEAYNRMSEQEYIDSIDVISESFKRLDNSRGWNVDEIIEIAEYAVYRYGIKTITIDPYNKLRHTKTDREDKYVDEILSKLLQFARKHDVFVIFIAHPTKMTEKKAVPSLSNISGGNAWFSMADYGIIIHRYRDEETQELLTQSKIIVEKIKDDTIGRTGGGVAYLDYNFHHFALVDATKPIEPKNKEIFNKKTF